jgi:hypothetical protein
MDFDETRLYYSHQQLQRPQQHENDNEEPAMEEDEDAVDLKAVRRHFREFLSKLGATMAAVQCVCV